MTFTYTQIIIAALVLLLLGGIFSRIFRKDSQEGFFSRIFKTNKDLDSTIDHLALPGILTFMLISFHDDLINPASAGLVLALFTSAFGVYQSMITGKTVRDMQNGHNGKVDNNGKSE